MHRHISSGHRLASAVIVFGLLTFTVPSFASATTAATISSIFGYSYNSAGTLNEAGSVSDSSSPYWWLNSGGKMPIKDGVGGTIHGSLSLLDPWRILYNLNSPVDTDLGAHPQNLFRLVSRSLWENVRVESSYRIDNDNFSASPNRNASNGLLLMMRHADAGKTLYYFGIRVDGTAVIKKKYKGAYQTIATKKIYPGTYVTGSNVNLLPHNAWISLAAETVTNADGSVALRFFVKNPSETTFTKILEATDSGQYGGTPPITGKGNVGMRTDFMDISFDNFKAVQI